MCFFLTFVKWYFSHLTYLSCPRRGLYPLPKALPPFQGEGCNRAFSGMQPRLLGALHYGTAPFEMVAGELLTQQSCDCLCSLRSQMCGTNCGAAFCFSYLAVLFVFTAFSVAHVSFSKALPCWFTPHLPLLS